MEALAFKRRRRQFGVGWSLQCQSGSERYVNRYALSLRCDPNLSALILLIASADVQYPKRPIAEGHRNPLATNDRRGGRKHHIVIMGLERFRGERFEGKVRWRVHHLLVL